MIQPPRDSDDDFLAPDSPATIERKHKIANWKYIKQCFNNSMSRQGITDEILEQSR